MNKIDFIYIFEYHSLGIDRSILYLKESIKSLKKNSIDNLNIIIFNASNINIHQSIEDIQDISYIYIPHAKVFNKSIVINYVMRHIVSSEYFFLSDINIIYNESYITDMMKHIQNKPVRVVPCVYQWKSPCDTIDYNILMQLIGHQNKTQLHGLGLIHTDSMKSVLGYNESLTKFSWASRECDIRINKINKLIYDELVSVIHIDDVDMPDNDTNQNLFNSLVSKLYSCSNHIDGLSSIITNKASTWGSMGKEEESWWNLPGEDFILKQWYMSDGESQLRIIYPLNEKSIVVDAGAYLGEWSDKIYKKYNCQLFLFEPVTKFYLSILESLCDLSIIDYQTYLPAWIQQLPIGISIYDMKINLYEFLIEHIYNKKIQVYQSALGSKSINDAVIYIERDSSSICQKDNSENTETIKMMEFMEFVSKNNLTKIDLLKLNIEGSEYDVLENIIDKKFINNIDNIQVQFHKWALNAVERREAIHKELLKTHYLTYNFPWIWENWRIRK